MIASLLGKNLNTMSMAPDSLERHDDGDRQHHPELKHPPHPPQVLNTMFAFLPKSSTPFIIASHSLPFESLFFVSPSMVRHRTHANPAPEDEAKMDALP